MIIDTTYLLPLARIRVEADLLRALVEDRLKKRIDFKDIGISMISIFELQAKASKLGIPPKYVSRAIDVVFRAFNIIPFYRRDIIEIAHKIHREINDYIDSIILATAIAQKDELVTEDKLIHTIKDKIEKQYGIKILRYKDLVKSYT